MTTSIARAPSIDLVKSAAPLTVTAGVPITYTFVVTNTGNVNLNNPTVTEGAFTGLNPAGMTAPDCGAPAPTVLAPGDPMTCTATYVPVQADVDGGALTNTATATGTPNTGAAVMSPQRTVTLPAVQDPSMSIEKSASGGPFTRAGQVVTYNFLVTNTGNVTLTGVNVVEGALSGSGSMSAPVCPAAEAASMVPGAPMTCTASYTLTQADVDTGQVTNTAASSGLPPSGPAVASAPDTAVVTIPAGPAIAVVKSASGGPFTRAGQVATYNFLVTNTGNVTLTGVGITETAFSGTGTVSTPVCLTTTLAPAGTTTCSANYSLSQADVDAEVVTNTATAQGNPPNGPGVESIPSDAVVPIAPSPGISLTKSVDRSAVTGADEQVTYSFEITNTGESTLHAITVTETAFTGTGTLATLVCPVTSLAPGVSTTCTAAYQLTSADAIARQVDNTATVTGIDPFNLTATSSPSSARVLVNPLAAVLGQTGQNIAIGTVITGIGALVAGLVMLILRRRVTRRPTHRT